MTDFATLFDADWYLKNNPDIAEQDIDPLEHYLADGWREGRDPHPMFDTSYYIEQNPDVLRADYNPLIHYDRHGWREGRKPHPDFDTAWYLQTYPDVAEAEMNPLQHFIEYGVFEGRKINPRWRPGSQPELFFGGIGERRREMCEEAAKRFAAPGADVSRIKNGPLLSILTVIRNDSVGSFRQLLESVKAQTYDNWELCVATAGAAKEFHAVLEKEQVREPRIRLHPVDESDLAAAGNAALKMAKGSYILLTNPHDVLTYDALEEVAAEIGKFPDTDFIYADECKIDSNNVVFEPFPKPDWSPYLLLNYMYTGRFGVYRKTAIENAGGFRREHDAASDYDLLLRLSERNPRVRHIRKILFAERTKCIPDKKSELAALQDAASRRGIPAKAQVSPGAFRLAVDRAAINAKIGIIIPSDNLDNIRESVNSIIDNSSYRNYEIIVVTKSAIVDVFLRYHDLKCRFVRYDKPFNFSDKCNAGVAATDADFVVFFNDDVRVISADWMEATLECFQLGNAGVVGPKLIYENHTIQHAGMVTGVRRLYGTAFHAWPENDTGVGNLVRCMREVSLICGACLAMPKALFDEVGGFNTEDTPIAHSDIDLCFKVREKGYTCVYTPHATLFHIGHMSIGAIDLINLAETGGRSGKKKVDLFTLKGWPQYVEDDPYFPSGLRDIEYSESPEKFAVYASAKRERKENAKDVLVVSHDLSLSGAPRIAVQIAELLNNDGHYVTVISPEDGPYRKHLTAAGITVIIDELFFYEKDWMREFALNFDLAIVSTIVGWPFVREIGPLMKVYWYLQEDVIIPVVCENQPEAEVALSCAAQLWANSTLTANVLATFGKQSALLEYGYEPVPNGFALRKPGEPVVVLVCGTYEKRKGQDIAAESIKLLAPELRKSVKLKMFGRILKVEKEFYSDLLLQAKNVPEVEVHTEIPTEQVMQEILSAHIVLVPSRSDAVNLVAIDGMRAGKVVVVSPNTGASEYIVNGQSGYVATETSAKGIAASLTAALHAEPRWQEIGRKAQEPFEGRLSAKTFAENVRKLIGV